MTEGLEPTAPVRVLHLTKGLGPGGAERLLLTLALCSDAQRVRLRAAYLLPWKDHLVPALEDAGVEVTCLHGGRRLDPRWALRLRRLVRREGIQIVHVHSPVAAAVARIALRLPGAGAPRIVGTEHNMWTSHHRLTRLVNRSTLPLQDATIAVSRQVLESMPERRRTGTEVLIHGADVPAIAARRSERAAARAELRLADDDVAVVTIANLRANKDYPTLMRAAAQVQQQRPRFKFLSVGQGPQAAELRELRDRLHLGDTFRFLGHREDPIRVLVAGDVFCLSSRYEGLAIALVEALAAGLPAVVTAVGGMQSVVRDGVEGRLVPPGDPAALAAALVETADPEVRRARGEAAAIRALAFDANAAVARQLDLYEELSGRVR